MAANDDNLGRSTGNDEMNEQEKEEEEDENVGGGGVNDYEAERARRIAANKERMKALGLGSGGIRIGGGAGTEHSGVGYEPKLLSPPTHPQKLKNTKFFT
jgi:hypothetical protein